MVYSLIFLPFLNESAEAVIRHNVYQQKSIATISVDENVELLTDDTALVEGQDKLMTSGHGVYLLICLPFSE